MAGDDPILTSAGSSVLGSRLTRQWVRCCHPPSWFPEPEVLGRHPRTTDRRGRGAGLRLSRAGRVLVHIAVLLVDHVVLPPLPGYRRYLPQRRSRRMGKGGVADLRAGGAVPGRPRV